MRTFDLHTARHALHDCPCPNHGTEKCDCQMVILLVYGKASDVSTPLNASVSTPLDTSPVTLILHGNDGRTWLSLVDTTTQHEDSSLQESIERALQTSLSQSGL